MVPRAEVEKDEPALMLARFTSVDPRAAVLMAHDPLAGLPGGDRQPFAPASWLSRDPDHPRLEVSTTAPCLLVISDTWLPGWSAQVDGKPAPVFRGNLAQRVIPIGGPGRHRVDLHYSPPGLKLGGLITAGSALIWTVLGLLAVRRRRQSATIKALPERHAASVAAPLPEH